MCESTVVKELPETSIWHGAISDEDVALVRRRHAEKVEEWLDYADFATELFALHERYGIEMGEEGYFAYRKHLRTSYYEKLYTYGPTPDPLDEGCDCIFCRMHADEPPAETEREAETETVVHTTASGESELPEATSKKQGTKQKRKTRRLGQVPAESPIDSGLPPDQTPLPKSASIPITKPGSKKLGPVPAYEKIDDEIEPPPYEEEYERVAGDTSRYDSVGGVEPDWGKKENQQPGPIVPIYPLNPSPPPSPYSKARRLGKVPAEPPTGAASPRDQSSVSKSASNAMTKTGSKKLGPIPAYKKIDDETGPYVTTEHVPAESPAASTRQEERRRREKRYGPDPVYVKTAGEKAWLKKMSSSVF